MHFALLSVLFASLAGPALAQSSNISKLQGDTATRAGEDEGPPITFYADLNADEESAETYSPGKGRFEVALDRQRDVHQRH